MRRSRREGDKGKEEEIERKHGGIERKKEEERKVWREREKEGGGERERKREGERERKRD